MKCTICGGEWEAPEGFAKVTKCIFCGDPSGLLDIPFVDDDEDENEDILEEPVISVEQDQKQEIASVPESEPESEPELQIQLEQESKPEPELELELEPEPDPDPEQELEPELKPEQEQNQYAESVIEDETELVAVVETEMTTPEPQLVAEKSQKSIEPPMFNGIPMVHCPAGFYIAGSPLSEIGRWNDEYQRKITITKDFYIGIYPITQSMYCSITEKDNPSIFINDNNPVDNVDWNEAKQFCEILNRLTEGQRPKGYRYDLPTSAQWEYACRAGTKESLNSGRNISNSEGICKELDEVAWYAGNSDDVIHPVGLKKPNGWGIFDMHGNIWEWCRDLAKSSVKVDETDPVGETSGEMHTCRGGSWNSEPRYCRSASRLACSNFDSCTQLTGFRVVLQKY